MSCSAGPAAILDIGGGKVQSFNKSLIEQKLFWAKGPFATLSGHVIRVLPASVIHSDKGLEIWPQITRQSSYYQMSGELALLSENLSAIERRIRSDSVLIDLGCGDIRKVVPLLQQLNRAQKRVQYCPLDLSRLSIEKALDETQLSRLPYITVTGLWGSFEDGVDWVNRTCGDRPRMFLSLGSIFGNDHFEDAVARLKWLRSTGLRTVHDTILLTMDGTQDAEKIHKSYDDPEGLFTKLIRQGYENSNAVVGTEWYREEDWLLTRRLTRNPTLHQFVLRAKAPVLSRHGEVLFRQGAEIDCYKGFKYGPEEMSKQFRAAGLLEHARWKSPCDAIYQYLLGNGDFTR